MEPRTSPPKNVHPVHSWATSLQANSLLYGTTDVLVAVEQCTSMYTVQRRVCGANSLLLNFTDIPVRSEKPFTISFFANSLSGSVHPCTLPDASFCCAKTSLLIRTPDIRVRSETTRREHKLTAGVLFVRRGLFFVKRRRRCPPIFKKKVLKIFYLYSIIRNCTEI